MSAREILERYVAGYLAVEMLSALEAEGFTIVKLEQVGAMNPTDGDVVTGTAEDDRENGFSIPLFRVLPTPETEEQPNG